MDVSANKQIDVILGSPNIIEVGESGIKVDVYTSRTVDVQRGGFRVLDIYGIGSLAFAPWENKNNPLFSDLVPPTATALVTTAGFSSVMVSWAAPNYTYHSHTEVWRNTTDNRGTAILVGSPVWSSLSDPTEIKTTYYYWVRFISKAGVVGPWNAAAGTVATTGGDVSKLLSVLQSKFDENFLTTALSTRLNSIEVNGASYAQEVIDRIASIGAETTARIIAVQQEIGDRGAAIALEVTQRDAAIVAAIILETTARTAAITTAVAVEVGDRTAAVQTQAIAVAGLSAQYTVKVDVNGYVAGYGLATTSVDGVPTANMTFLVDEFFIASPGKTSLAFAVVDNKVTMDAAYIVNLTADNIDTRNLTIKDAAGNIIFSSGVPLDYDSNVTGGPPTNADATNYNDSRVSNNLQTWLNLKNQNGEMPGTYIASLAADKITSGVFRTAASGARIEITFAGNDITVYNSSGQNVAELRSTSGGGGALRLRGYNTDDIPLNITHTSIIPSIWVRGNAGSNFGVIDCTNESTSSSAVAARFETGNGAASYPKAYVVTGGTVAAGARAFWAERGGYYDNSGLGYNPFTGCHDGLMLKTVTPIPGDLLTDASVYARKGVSDVICMNILSTAAKEKGVVGIFKYRTSLSIDNVIAALSVPLEVTSHDGSIKHTTVNSDIINLIKDTHDSISMNSVGEGLVNVCGQGGDLEVGDLICASDTAGKGMMQPDDLVHGYTVAKSREAVSFADPSEVKMVACIYLCG